MNKRLISLILAFFPILVFAAGAATGTAHDPSLYNTTNNPESSLSLAPPAGDYSMVFLANLFGVVDGVLHGSGSQIMGAMFSVFNSAVLALGGIVITYTLLVSTLNTAHEGQMLGQKWSSIWIPVRSTVGIGLLVPKASGYCMMQIFVMWVIVQGVGAADKVWEAALGYMNRGGVIIQSQPDPAQAMIDENSGAAYGPATGAKNILIGQVCMLGIQKQLENVRNNLLNGKTCTTATDPYTVMLCKNAIPDFLNSVNFVDAQQTQSSAQKTATPPTVPTSFSVTMPNLTNTPYSGLNGLCGTLSWNAVGGGLDDAKPTTGATSSFGTNREHSVDHSSTYFGFGGNNTTFTALVTLSASQLQTAQLSRAIALQQMYLDLQNVTETMVNNDPQLNGLSNNPSNKFSLVANSQFGVPYDDSGAICHQNNDKCTTWGPANSTSGANGVLFNGTEFMGAVSDYNGIMFPTLNLIQQIKDGNSGSNARAFISQANSQGWMMAGAYFFDLVALNGSAIKSKNLNLDTQSGLDSDKNKEFQSTSISSASPGSQEPASRLLWNLLGTTTDALNQIVSLISGKPALQASVPDPTSMTTLIHDRGTNNQAVVDQGSSTVYGFVANSTQIQLPGQPGIQPLQFANIINFSVSNHMYYLEQQNFDCGYVKTFVFSFCLGALLGDIFYNGIIYVIYNALVFFFQQFIQQVVMSFIMIPITGMSAIFKQGLATISEPGTNPIIALANKGVMYINFSGNLWMGLMAMAVTSALIPLFGIFIFALLMFVMPLIIAWVGVMVSIGFTTSYYIPVLPYMIFTFGAIAWLITVVEAMVAAPLVALGVTHPEGHDAFGKGEAAIMLLMNVFLRPAMMIIGYISAIALSYVGVWILNAGFDHAILFVQGGGSTGRGSAWTSASWWTAGASINPTDSSYGASLTGTQPQTGSGTGGYSDWAGIYAFFFSILVYTTMYLTVVQKAFTLIFYLPDKVLRWIGGNPESIGSESAQWGDEHVKGKVGDAAKETHNAQGQMSKQNAAHAQKGVGSAKDKLGKGKGAQGAEASGGS